MRGFDFTSWESIVSTLVGLALVTMVGMGLRIVMMLTLQQRRERLNRQINERLRTLIAAYKTLGGSFTGALAVDPRHRKDRRRSAAGDTTGGDDASPPIDIAATAEDFGSDRARRIRDAVEAALSDIVLLGTPEQARLAASAASELAAGRPIEVHALVVSLRGYIREALDLEPLPDDLAIPPQGPARPAGAGGPGARRGEAGGGRAGGGMGGGMGAGVAGLGMGAGLGAGLGSGSRAGLDAADDPADPTGARRP
ncbi:MAG: hypothetical protein IPL88_01580 [Rhizobiales bacterium]|nr:hypothetical protein [Hyphomicrobiales bacterium]